MKVQINHTSLKNKVNKKNSLDFFLKTPHTINMIELSKKASKLTKDIELNNLGLPIYLYDLELNKKYLDYSEGFPAIENSPIWLKLPFEDNLAYESFSSYLSQTDIRSIVNISHIPTQSTKSTSLNTIPYNPTPTPTLDNLREYFNIFSWLWRAKAYDLFYIAHLKQSKELRDMETRNDDYLRSNRLIAMADKYIEKNSDILLENLTPKLFIDFLKLATDLRRSALSKSTNNTTSTSGSTSAGIANQTIDDVMLTVVNESKISTIKDDTNDSIDNDIGQMINSLDNSDALSLAQELIFKTNAPPTPKKDK